MQTRKQKIEDQVLIEMLTSFANITALCYERAEERVDEREAAEKEK